jgi:alkanesulfonate monooxygenase SsuD/methylene tetrahydromethanopterin reductase-like flavin-dependent oxidoreductase (luciferase family)
MGLHVRVAQGTHQPRFGALVLPNEPWGDLEARWRRLEGAGLDTLWSCDHFTNPHRPGQPWFEGWSTLVGMAAVTTRVRIGLLVGAIVSRPPTLFAKQAQAVDHASGGRLEVGLGAGGAPTDQPMWGVDPWSPAERADRFAEYVELVDRLLRSETVTHAGRWYATEGAEMAPGTVQRPRPPIVLAAHGPKTLATAAAFADTWNTFGPSLEDARRSAQALDAACDAIGRDPATIRRSALIGLTEGTAWTSALEFEGIVHDWAASGFTDFVFYDPPYARAGVPVAEPNVLDELVADVIPRLRRELP